MSTISQCQLRYWKELHEFKVHVYYLELYLQDSELWDRRVNIFLAITSSSSICGWVIWSKFSFIWGVIIAASQLVTVIKHFLPYNTRIKAISSILTEFYDPLTNYEKNWYQVAESYLTDEEINSLQFELRTEKNKITNRHLGSNTLPVKQKLFDKAKVLADTYFNNYYGE